VIEVRESLGSSLESLRSHALRSVLSMLGIIFGTGAVIAMLSIGAGAEQQALEIIDAMGLRNVVVTDKKIDRENELMEVRRKSAGLAARDAEAIKDAVPGVELVVARIEVEPWKVLSATGRAKPKVIGVSHEYAQLVKMPVREGRFFDAHDEQTFSQVCVIGDGVRRELEPGQDQSGHDLAALADAERERLGAADLSLEHQDVLALARFPPPGGRVQDIHMEAGQVRWIWDESRSEKNLSTHPVEMLLIEVKRVR